MAKKILALLLAVMMIVCITACGEKEKTDNDKDESKSSQAQVETVDDILGIYTCLAISSEGVTIDPVAVGATSTLEFKKDGVLVFTTDGESSEGAYTAEDGKVTMTVDGESITCTVEDGVILLDEDDTKAWYVKEGASLPADVKDQIVDLDDLFGDVSEDEADEDDADEDQDDTSLSSDAVFYYGTWEHTESEDGVVMSISVVLNEDGTFNMTMGASYEGEDLEVEEFEGTYTSSNEGVVLTNPEFPDEPLVLTYEGGKLVSEELEVELQKK